MKLRKSLIKPVMWQKTCNYSATVARVYCYRNLIITIITITIILSCSVLPPQIVMHDDTFNVIL